MNSLVQIGADGAYKLRPQRERFEYWDGYRENIWIAWILDGGFELFGAACPHCRQAWGWSPDIGQVRRLRRAMKRHGCPRCVKGRLS